jgi:ribosomal protein S18 acetylase RimI-like enzyme
MDAHWRCVCRYAILKLDGLKPAVLFEDFGESMNKEGHSSLAALRFAVHGTSASLLPAAQATPRDRSQIINEAYADYWVPTRIGEAQMRRMDEIYDVDLAHSVAARAGNEWVGMAMLSHRGRRGWISSVGVVQAWRRRGLARAMMERLLASAEDLGLTEVTLEVIDRNDPARGLYESLGFRVGRELLSWRRDTDADGLPAPKKCSTGISDGTLNRRRGNVMRLRCAIW